MYNIISKCVSFDTVIERNEMMTLLEYLKDCSLFADINEGELNSIIEEKEIFQIEWKKNDCMEADRGLYIICSGKIRVCKKEDGRELFLKYLVPGDSFGYTKLFSSGDYRQQILLFAKEKTKTLFISEQTVRELIETHPQLAINIISILTDKIRFLNRKIDSFTSPTTESRLLKYLLSCTDDGDGQVVLEESMAELARKLDMGRASLYRAFDSLEKNGDISRKNDEIYILRKQKDNFT